MSDPSDDHEYLAAHARWAAARAEPGLALDPGGARQVVRRDDVAEALRHVDTFVGSLGDVSAVPADEQILQWVPEPRHGKLRRVVNGVIAPHRLAPVEPFVRDLATQLLRDAADTGAVELVAAFVDPLPTRTIAHVFGIPGADADRFGQMSDEFLADQAKLLDGTIGEVHPEFTAYVERLVADRRAQTDPPDDVITRLIQADIEGERLSDAAVRTQMMMLIIAGNETTRNLLGNLLHTLASCPDLYQRLREDPSLSAPIIEESLRRDSPVQLLFRTCSGAARLGDTELAADDRVMLCVGAANRDERYFDDPDEFRVERSNLRDHVAFGAGPHVCPGATLARLEARIALEVLVAHVRELRLAAGHGPTFNEVFWARGLRSLWVEWENVVPAG